eukprot:scaffold15011_cov89-Skeletonema_dohrnii-CCMP3373.AAC.3
MMQDDYSSRRRRLGVRLIQQRWRRGGCTSKNHHPANNKQEVAAGLSCYNDNHDDADICHDDKRQKRSTSRDSDTDSLSCNNYSSPYNNSAGTTIANTTSSNNNKPTTSAFSIQPTLLFRRTNSNLYYSNERHYTNIQFLNSGQPIVIGVDNYGDLDVVRVPSFGCGGYHVANDNDDEDGGGGGMGTLQADRMPLFSNTGGGNGPRVPTMDNFHCELFGYDNGTRFAVGLGSGRMQLFTTERAAAASAGNCVNGQREDTSSSLGSTNALWSCLPSTTNTTIGPQRRYHKSDKYPLSTMLSSTTNKTSLFDAYNTSFLEEISDWDNNHNDALTPSQHHLLQGDGCPWAFREGGCGSLSGTALIGACVDAENGDCFSLRVVDERQQSNNNGNGSDASACASTMNVVVVDDRKDASFKPINCRERVESVCFSGEYGLVTSHSIARNDDMESQLTATCIKWWDHRMLRSHQPVNSMCLSFPRDNVSLLSPDMERCLAGSFCDSSKNQGHTACTHSSLRELSSEQPLDRTNFGLFQVNRLVGARDSSDRFAIHMTVCSHEYFSHHDRHEEVLMVDSCRGEVTQQMRRANPGGLSLCISSYLDTMACFTTKTDEEQCVSIYDVSRHRSDDNATGRHDPFEYLSGKKHLLHNDEVSHDDETSNEGLLRRLLPEVHDRYGIDSSLSCMAIDEYGVMIACGTGDGDMFLLSSSDLDEAVTEKMCA